MARSFDSGSSEYLYNDTGVLSGVPFTMAGWIYFTDATNDRPLIWVGDKDAVNHRAQLMFQDTGALLNFQYETASGSSEADGGSMSVNTWYHIAGVCAGTASWTAYLDGSAGTENTTDVGDLTAIDRVAIGAEAGSSPAEYMHGHLAEAAIWDVALSQAEITMLAAGFSPLFVRPQNLVFYLPMVRDEDVDHVGGLSMTAAGTPTVADHPPKIIYPIYPTFGFPAAQITVEQEGYRWRNDDGSESAATWRQVQDTADTVVKNTNIRLRTLLNATGDPAAGTYQVEYKESGDSDAEYRAVPL